MAISQDQSWISKNWDHVVAANHEVFLVPEFIFLVPEILCRIILRVFWPSKKNSPPRRYRPRIITTYSLASNTAQRSWLMALWLIPMFCLLGQSLATKSIDGQAMKGKYTSFRQLFFNCWLNHGEVKIIWPEVLLTLRLNQFRNYAKMYLSSTSIPYFKKGVQLLRIHGYSVDKKAAFS